MIQNIFFNKLKEINPELISIEIDNKLYTYKDLISNILKKYDFFNNNLSQGEVIAILGDYSFDSISTLLALYFNKNIIVPIISENKNEINNKIEISETNYIYNTNKNELKKLLSNNKSDNQFYESLKKEGKSGLVLFSSGSSGNPKAMLHDFDNLIFSYLSNKLKVRRFLVFLLFDHIGGINTLLNIISMGAVIHIPTKRDPDYISNLIQNKKIQILPSSPTFLNLMMISNCFKKYDLSSLILITYGTERMPESLLMKIQQELPKTKLLQTFGTSETGIIKSQSKSSSSLFMKFNDKDQKVKIVSGELWIKSKTQVLGYLNHSNDSFTEDGWFKTGDLVEIQDDGYLKILGRKSSTINVGGEKVLPIEIEKIINKLDFVIDTTVFAKENAITGQTVVAKVVIKSTIDPINAKKKIRVFCKENLDRFKVPSKIIIIDNLHFNNRFKKDLN